MVGNVVSPHTPLPHVCPTASGWGIKIIINAFAFAFDASMSSEFPALIYIYIFFFVSIAIFILSIKFQPIKLKDIGEHFFTLIIRNDEYADEFSLINNIKKT